MRNILFVCTANIARSPMAEALFNHMMMEKGLSDQFRAQSAGTWGWDGVPAPSEGVEVMSNHNIDIRSHRSRIVTAEITTAADLILTMEQGQKESLQIEFPTKKEKVHMLTELVGLPYDIRDPYGMGLEAFQETANELQNIIVKGIDEILRRADPNHLNK